MSGFFDRLTRSEAPMDALPLEENDETPADSQTCDDGGNNPRTHKTLREAVQELLKYGLLEASHKPNLYRAVLANGEAVTRILEPLDLAIGIDEIRGLIFVVVSQESQLEQEDWSHPLVRRQRLNLEQSLLVAILRQHFITSEQEGGTGAVQSLVAVDELSAQLQAYLGDPGSEAKERTRVLNLLDQLKGHGIVSAPDNQDRVTIRPLIAHLANPENLQALIQWLEARTGNPLPQEEGDEPLSQEENI